MKKVKLFSQSLQVKVNEKMNLISPTIAGTRHMIQTNLDLASLLNLKKHYIDKIWSWPEAVFYNTSEKSSEIISMVVDQAQLVLPGGFHYSGSTIDVLVVNYSLKYTGDREAFQYSKGGGAAFEFWGKLDLDAIEYELYTNKPATAELGNEFKQQKAEFVAYIEKTLIENQEYLKVSKLEFEKAVSDVVDEIYKSKKEIEDRNSLF